MINTNSTNPAERGISGGVYRLFQQINDWASASEFDPLLEDVTQKKKALVRLSSSVNTLQDDLHLIQEAYLAVQKTEGTERTRNLTLIPYLYRFRIEQLSSSTYKQAALTGIFSGNTLAPAFEHFFNVHDQILPLDSNHTPSLTQYRGQVFPTDSENAFNNLIQSLEAAISKNEQEFSKLDARQMRTISVRKIPFVLLFDGMFLGAFMGVAWALSNLLNLFDDKP